MPLRETTSLRGKPMLATFLRKAALPAGNALPTSAATGMAAPSPILAPVESARPTRWSGTPAPGRRRGAGHFYADTPTPSPAQDAGTGSKHLFPLPDGPRGGPAPRHARKGAPPRHAGLAALWASEGKGPSHVPGRSP